MEVAKIAQISHETIRAYCRSIGDNSQPTWEEASEDVKKGKIRGVQFILDNPSVTPQDQHNKWLDDKISAGWVYGAEKSEAKKTHPCIAPYEKLPEEQQRKDSLFQSVVRALI